MSMGVKLCQTSSDYVVIEKYYINTSTQSDKDWVFYFMGVSP